MHHTFERLTHNFHIFLCSEIRHQQMFYVCFHFQDFRLNRNFYISDDFSPLYFTASNPLLRTEYISLLYIYIFSPYVYGWFGKVII